MKKNARSCAFKFNLKASKYATFILETATTFKNKKRTETW